MELNLADLFECVADEVAGREALVCGERRLTYAELDERATRLAHGMSGLGVVPGDRVALYMYNCAEFVEAMLGCFKLRAVPININYRYGAPELAYLLANAQAAVLVHHRSLEDSVAAVQDRAAIAELKARVVVEDEPGHPGEMPGGVLAYEALVGSGGSDRDFPERSAGDHYILYTGGTTGMPRGVVWRQEDILYATLGGGNAGGPPIKAAPEIGAAVRSNRAQRITPFLPPGDPGPQEFISLALGPLVHGSGQWLALSTLLGGGKVVLYPDRHMDLGRVLDLVESERVSMLTLVGDTSGRPLLEELRARPGRTDTSSLRLLGSGGSILSAEVKDELLTRLPTVLAISEAVGSTEAPVQAVAVARAGHGPSGSLEFAPLAGATTVLGDDLEPVPPGSGRVGRLATTGRVPIGYFGDPVKTAETFVEVGGVRWAMPGDMATVDADGTIRLLGRGALCINTGGEKVYPEEVEAALKAHHGVADAVVVGQPDERLGETVVAVVAPSGRAPSLEELQSHCRARLAGYKVPRALSLVPEVRRSAAGKADYAWARAAAAGANRA